MALSTSLTAARWLSVQPALLPSAGCRRQVLLIRDRSHLSPFSFVGLHKIQPFLSFHFLFPFSAYLLPNKIHFFFQVYLRASSGDGDQKIAVREDKSRWRIDFTGEKPETPLLDTINFPIHMKNLSVHVLMISIWKLFFFLLFLPFLLHEICCLLYRSWSSLPQN